MADSDTQARTMLYAHGGLREHFRAIKRQAYVATDTLLFYRRGKANKRVAPDVMVIFGVPDYPRPSYKIWKEGDKAPDVVIEVQSTSTHLEDEGDKRDVYREMGVREYYRYDPQGDTMAPVKEGRRLIGECLEKGRWRPMPVQADGSIHSPLLGLDLRLKRKERFADWRELRFRDPATGKDLPSHGGIHAIARSERAAKERERAAKERERAAKERERAAKEREERRADEAERKLEQEARARRQAERRSEDAERRSRQADRQIAELKALLLETRRRDESE